MWTIPLTQAVSGAENRRDQLITKLDPLRTAWQAMDLHKPGETSNSEFSWASSHPSGKQINFEFVIY